MTNEQANFEIGFLFANLFSGYGAAKLFYHLKDGKKIDFDIAKSLLETGSADSEMRLMMLSGFGFVIHNKNENTISIGENGPKLIKLFSDLDEFVKSYSKNRSSKEMSSYSEFAMPKFGRFDPFRT